MGSCPHTLGNFAPCSMTLLIQNQCNIFYHRQQISKFSHLSLPTVFFSKHLEQKNDTN